MRRLILLFIVMGFAAQGQGTDPVYYTDSDITVRPWAFEASGAPLTMFRRVGRDLQGNLPEVNDTWRPRAGLDAGVNAIYQGGNIRLSVGLSQTWLNWATSTTVNDEEILVSTHAQYLSLPIRAGLVTHLTDMVDLEVWPNFTYRWNQSLVKTGTNIEPVVSPTASSAGLDIGASWRVGTHWRYFVRGGIGFGLQDLEVTEDVGNPYRNHTELPLFVGVQTGIRALF